MCLIVHLNGPFGLSVLERALFYLSPLSIDQIIL